MKKSIDWSIFKDDEEYTCYCNCGNVFKSYAKYVSGIPGGLQTQKPCPKCGNKKSVYRIASETETLVI